MNITAPTHIAKDAFTGKHVVTRIPKGSRITTWKASELAQFSNGKPVILFERGWDLNGSPMFYRTRFISDANGNLHGYDSDGARKIIHPADRDIQILTK